MNFFMAGFLVMFCSICSYTDLKFRTIPNKLTYPLLVIMLIVRMQEPGYYLTLIVPMLLFILYLFNPQVIGAGDTKMLALLGLCVGEKILLVIFGMCLSSIIFLIINKCKSKQVQSIPLAPFISLGVLLALMT
ncbi:Flp pilus assembly protein protease CpaA [Fontibacillus solani]|uniref:Flp pilus assembly protein protease CpaA n=2 Tax=Fontibacillus solani TaxID=1572857 RepID=A0A7W3XSF4_9BACL|nr:Flp pilus assembly protein protease CpaA [Fontibacillus solani]